jgi:3-oxoadipate enol-lactonase
VLSGSLASTTAMWDAQAAALGGFEVVRVEHPGHGGTPMIELHDIGDLARYVLETVQAERFSFVGLSLGGVVGMEIALGAPQRINRLVLACTAARFATPDSWDARIQLVRAGGMAAVADEVLPRWFTPRFTDLERFREMFLALSTETYVRYCELLRDLDLSGALGAIDAPTLAIAAAEDPTTPPSELEALAAAIPRARVVLLERAAHLANVERPDEFNAALLGHLAA